MVTVSEMATDARVCREAEALVDAGFEVEILCLGSELEATVRGARLAEKRFSRKIPARLRLLVMALYFFVATVARSADVYHAHNVPALPGCWLAARLRRSKLVYDAHELYAISDRLPKGHGGRHTRRQRVEARLEEVLGTRAELMLTASPGYGRVIAKALRVPPPQAIPNYPPLPPRLESDRLRQLSGAHADDVVMLYQGGFYLSSRALDVVVRSLTHLPAHYRLVLLGFGVGDEGSQLERLAADLGVSDRFTLLPPVPHQQLPFFTVGADIGIIPLKLTDDATRLCAPNKLYEYFQAGLPVLTTAAEELALLVESLHLGAVYDYDNPLSLAREALRLGTRGQLGEIGMRARQVAEEKYSWEAVSHLLVDSYRREVS